MSLAVASLKWAFGREVLLRCCCVCSCSSLASSVRRAACASVCKRWQAAALAEPALWRSLTLTPGALPALATLEEQQQWLAAKRRLLQRVAALVTHVAVCSAGQIRSQPAPRGAATGCQLAALLRQLQPGVLQGLALNWAPVPIGHPACTEAIPFSAPQVPAAAVRLLPRFTHGLTALHLESWQLPHAAATAIPQLTGLLELVVVGRSIAASLADGIAASLHALTSLKLTSSVPLPPLQQLTSLSRLVSLQLTGYDERASEQPLPAPAQFSSLARYKYASWHCHLETQEGLLPVVEVQGGRARSSQLSQVPACHASKVSQAPPKAPHSIASFLQVADAAGMATRLYQVSYGWHAPRYMPGGTIEVPPPGRLWVHLNAAGEMRPGGLSQLLAALVPPGGEPLATLELTGNLAMIGAAAMPGCTQLSSLTSLHLRFSPEPLLPSLLRHAPRLADLCCSPSSGRLPPELVGLAGLTRLQLHTVAGGVEWPEGPYLQCELARLPCAVGGPPCATLALTLPCTVRTAPPLDGTHCACHQNHFAFAPCCAALQELHLSGVLPCLPRALARASNLRRLNLGWAQLALSMGGVEEVLLRLPALAHLNIRGLHPAPAVLIRLAQGAPLLHIEADAE